MAKKDKPIITICSSAHFYKQAGEIKDQLSDLGFEVIIPRMAERMRETGDYEVERYKTWYADPNDYHKKAELMHAHFDRVDEGDAILVLNFEKKGVPNYIGGNVLMEMALAFHQRKPIIIYNQIPEESAFLEEIKGMQPVELKGDVKDFPRAYTKVGSKASS